MTDLQNMSLAQFVQALGSTEPAPGAGAAAGVCLALAAGCAAKAFAISARHGHQAQLEGAAREARALAQAALGAARRDAEDFPALLRGDPAATGALVKDGEGLIAIADKLQSLVGDHADATSESLAGDLAAAAALIRAAAEIQRRNLAELDPDEG